MKKMLKISRVSFLTIFFLTTAYALLLSGTTMAVVNSGEQVPQLPHGASVSWWVAVQEDIRRSEYKVTWHNKASLLDIKGAYQSPNRSHNFRIYFTHEGIRVTPRTPGNPNWLWGLSLKGYGFKGDVRPIMQAELSISGNRAEYRRGALTEWYVNDKRGLEQGFTLSAPHRSQESDTTPWIVLEMDLYGDVKAVLESDASELEFITAHGTSVIRYSELHVYDATGKELPSKFNLADARVDILIDTSRAVYPITVDPLATSPSWTAESNQTDPGFGVSVSTAGDVNSDGYADVIIGAPYYDNGEEKEGRAYVYYGSSSGLSTTPNWALDGSEELAKFGDIVGTAGDVNGDGYSDVIIAAARIMRDSDRQGRVYLYYGSSSGLSATTDWWVEPGQDRNAFSSAATAGDVNGDGYNDVILGASGFANGGRVYVYHGSSGGLSATVGWEANCDQADARFGNSVATAGDVNGDGFSDIIIGAYWYDYDNRLYTDGRAYVYHGSSSGLSSNADWEENCDQADAMFGWSVATAGDVNGDSYSDVIIGAPSYVNGGRAYVYYGSSSGLSTTFAWEKGSGQAGADFGWSVATAGDVNGDGYSDIIIGAKDYNNGQISEGRAYVYCGSSSGPNDETADWKAECDQAHCSFGQSVATAGDVNGDGFSDIIVGAPGYSNGQSYEGGAFVYYYLPPEPNINIDNVLCIPNSIIPGNSTTIKIQVNNRGDSKETTFIASKIIDPTGNEIDLEIKSHQLNPDETITFDYQYTVPLDAELGQYDITAQLYENCSGICTDPIGSPYIAENAFEVSEDADITPPTTISDLTAVEGDNRGEIRVSWTAPADDGTTGSASGYIVKYATVPINENNWNSSDTYAQIWTPETYGTMESKTLTGFPPGQEFYFALKATDDVLNESAVSNSVSAMSSSAEGANYVDVVDSYRIIADNITYLNPSEFEATGNVSLNEVLSFTGLVHINLTTLVITGDGDVFIPDVPMMGDVLLFKGGFEFDLSALITSGLETISQVAGIDLQIEEMEFLGDGLHFDGVRVTAKVKFPDYLASGEIDVNQLEISRTNGISGSIDIPAEDYIQIKGCEWKLKKSENYPTDPLLEFDSKSGLFKGKARLVLTKFELEANISFIDGQLYGIGMCYGFPEPGKPILIIPPPTGPIPVVFLQEICGGVENIPNPKALILRATADISAGPKIQDYYLVGLDNSGLELDISSRATLSGTLVLGGFYDLAYAEVFIDWHDEVFGANGEMNALNIFTAQANFLIDGELNIAGRAEGNLYIPDEWYYWPLRGKELADVLGLLDNDGIKGQVQIAGQDWLSAAFGFDWEGNFDVAKNIESLSTEELSGQKLFLRSIEGELLSFNIPAGSEVIYIRVRWTGEGTSSVELIKPDASRITPGDCNTDPDVYCESGTKEFWYALHNPVAGQWQVDIIDPENLGDITLEVLSGNGKPYIQVTEPSLDISTSTTLQIDWIDSDADDNATISLWYDTDSQGYDGSLIVDGLNEDDSVDTYTWDVTSIPTGQYYIYAQIDDSKNAPVRSYAAGEVTINNPLYPATPANLQATITDKLMELTWDEVTGCTYTLYYTEDTSADTYDKSFPITEDNRWIVDGSLGGKEIKFAVQAVDSELRASLISSPLIVTVPNRSAIKIEPSTIDFGDVSHVSSYTSSVLIGNSGTEDLVITSLKFDGVDKSAFDINKDCPLTISPGASQEVQLKLSPNKKGSYAAVFQVVSDDPSVAIVEVGLTASVNYLCECDLNHDGSCNILDWPYFIEDWGRTDCNEPTVTCECDLNGDGNCNILDWPYFIEDWGRTDCPN